MQQDDIILFFSKYIEKELGIIYSPQNYYQLQSRLDELVKILKIPDLLTLYHDVQSQSPRFRKQLLLDIATNNETSFFRDPRVFRSIEFVLKDLIEGCQKKNEPLKIWSAATSTGQEPVSVAILIEEFLTTMSLSKGYSIYCTDISERVLKRAQEGVYSDLEIHRGLSDRFLEKYFIKEGDKWKVIPQIKKYMEFQKQNLIEKFINPDCFNLVLCRNVLIYQNIESKKQILKKLSDSIISGGYLVLGAGESLLGLSSDFEQEVIDGAVFYRKKMY